MRPLRILTLAFLLFTLTAAAQTDRRIEEQKRVIAALEKRIATEEQEISKIQKGRTATEERVRRLARQIDSRNQLLDQMAYAMGGRTAEEIVFHDPTTVSYTHLTLPTKA